MGEVIQLGPEILVREKISQKDRILQEVMENLISMIPSKPAYERKKPDFTLKDGTQCYLKQFSEVKDDGDGDLSFGFDLIFEEGKPLDHLEFKVTCTGFGGYVVTPENSTILDELGLDFEDDDLEAFEDSDFDFDEDR